MLKNTKLIYVFVSLWYAVNSYFYEEEKKPSFLAAAVGDYVIFDCDLEFPQNIPIPYVLNWNKEGETVFSSNEGQIQATDSYIGRISFLDDQYPKYGRASINLTSIRETDAGWFECQILFPNRTPKSINNGTWFYLTVNGGNLLAVPPINQTIMEGSEVELSCVKKDPSTNISWYKNGIPLKDLPNLTQRTWITDEGSLIIRTTMMGDIGEYECEAESLSGDKQTAKAFLNVQYKAKVIYAPREVHLPYGKSAILDCHFRSNPPLTNLRWEKDGFLFDPYNVQGVFYKRNGSLYFSKVDESHGGYYSCTPYNELGTEGPSPSIHVIVQRPPIFVVTPHSMYLRKLGESIEIPCDARDGEDGHKPIIVWYKKDGNSLPLGRYTIRDGNLTVINIHEEDRGFYQCSASNEAATITAETELIVENVPPRAPHNLTALAYANAVHLTWNAAIKRPTVEYSIWYKPVEAQEWKTIKVSSKKSLEATINNLNPGREYEFMILSKNDNENGLFSKPIRVWTKGLSSETHQQHAGSIDQKIGPPKDVKVHTTDKGYLVTWDPPDYGLEELRVYIVRWFQGPREYLHGTSETKNTSYLIPNLEEGYEYHFQIVAMSYNDYQVTSQKVSITVPAYKTIRSISVGLVIGIAFVGIIIVSVYYIRKKWFNPYEENMKTSTI